MTDIVAYTPDQCFALAERISSSKLMPQAYRNNPEDAAIAMMYGVEMGLAPMTALQRIVVINGKPTLDAQGMVALIRQAGHSITGEVTDEGATVTGVRSDTGDTMTSTFTMDDAKLAGLAGSATYKKFPRDMMWARAVSQLGRRLFSDVLMAASYAPEEMQAISSDSDSRRDEIVEILSSIDADDPDSDARRGAKWALVQRFGAPDKIPARRLDDAVSMALDLRNDHLTQEAEIVEAEVIDEETGELLEDEAE